MGFIDKDILKRIRHNDEDYVKYTSNKDLGGIWSEYIKTVTKGYYLDARCIIPQEYEADLLEYLSGDTLDLDPTT